MRYKRKVDYVDAVRWTGENKEEVERFANGEIELSDFDRDYIVITTPNGRVMAEKGDWICKDAIGKLYPCSPEVFRMTYAVDTDYEIPIEQCCGDMGDAIMMNQFRKGIIYDRVLDPPLWIVWNDGDMMPLNYCPSCGKSIKIIGQKVSDNDLKTAIERLYDNIVNEKESE